jgi:molecular chaperone GrpE
MSKKDDKKIKENKENKECTKKPKVSKKDKKAKKDKLQEQIKALQIQLAEAEDKILRVHAEYDNYRKRAAREMQAIRDNAKVDTITPILKVYDHFKMAVSAAETSDDMEVIKQGMTMINSEFSKSMEDLGITEVNAIGEKFNPNIHEAIAKEASEEEEDTVIKQWQSGYMMNGKLIRPATVVVSSGPQTEAEEAE